MTDTLITVDLQMQKLLQRAREGQAAGREVQVDREQQQKVEAAGQAERGVRERITIPGQVLQQGRSRRGVRGGPQNVTKRPKEQPAAGYVQGADLAMWGPSDKYGEFADLSTIEWGFGAGWRGFAFVASSQMRTINAVGVYTPLASGLLTTKPVAVWRCSIGMVTNSSGEQVTMLTFGDVLAQGQANVGVAPQLKPYIFARVPQVRTKPGEIYAAMAHYEEAGNLQTGGSPAPQYPKDYPLVLRLQDVSSLGVPNATSDELRQLYQKTSKLATAARPVFAANSVFIDPPIDKFTSADPSLVVGYERQIADYSQDRPETLGTSNPETYATTLLCNGSSATRRPTWWRPPA